MDGQKSHVFLAILKKGQAPGLGLTWAPRASSPVPSGSACPGPTPSSGQGCTGSEAGPQCGVLHWLLLSATPACCPKRKWTVILRPPAKGKKTCPVTFASQAGASTGTLLFSLRPCWILGKMMVSRIMGLWRIGLGFHLKILYPPTSKHSCPLGITESRFTVEQAVVLASSLFLTGLPLLQPPHLSTWFKFSLNWILNPKLLPFPTSLYWSVFISLKSMVSCQASHPILQLLSCWLYYTEDFDSDQLELIAIFSKILTKHTQNSLVWLHPLLQ